MLDLNYGPLAESTGFLLHVAQIEDHESFARRFADQQVTPGVYSIITLIKSNPGVQQGVIAEALKIKPARMTKVIKKLVDKGLVARRIPETNRRMVHLSLTENGNDFLELHGESVERFMAQGCSKLSRHEQNQLNVLLKKMIAASPQSSS